jgi:hypothetical protein
MPAFLPDPSLLAPRWNRTSNLVLDERDAAAEEFGIAAKFQPRDKLSASLAAALTTRASDQKASEE